MIGNNKIVNFCGNFKAEKNLEEVFVFFSSWHSCSFFRYDITTGVFTVPPGGDGLYYFSTFLTAESGESATFDMLLNGERICSLVPRP